MRDQRECPDCYQPLLDCECEPLPEMRERLEREREQRKRAEEPWPETMEVERRECRRCGKMAIGAHTCRPKPGWVDAGGPLTLGVMTWAFVLLLSLPAFSAPICERAIDIDWGNTSTPRPKLAVETCQIVHKSAQAHDVDPTLAVAVASIESDFRPWAVSHAGAVGAMQVKPQYYCPKRFGFRFCVSRRELIDAGVRHLGELLDDYDTGHALRAYNAGRRGARLGRGQRYAESVIARRGLL